MNRCLNLRRTAFLFLFAFVLGLPLTGFAVTGSQELINFTQPDGRTFKARIMGDEHLNWVQAENGYTVVRNPINEFWEYAIRGVDDRLVGSGIVATSGAAALPAGMTPGLIPLPQGPHAAAGVASDVFNTPWVQTPVSGTRNVLVIMVGFANQPLTTSADSWYNTIFSVQRKSVAKFFQDNSFNTFNIAGISHAQSNNPGVISVRLNTNHPYPTSSDYTWETDVAMMNAALAQASPFVSFASYDANNDGILQSAELCVYFVIAGYEASGSGSHPSVWAHAWWTDGQGLSAGGKNIQRFGYNGELYDTGIQMTMGVVAHEMGHQLCGLPDLYDTAGHNAGMGNFSLMAGGSWGADVGEYGGSTPVAMDAWCREYLGWSLPKTVYPSSVTLGYPLLDANNTYKLVKSSTSTTEYWLVESRCPTGWDAGIRGKTGFGSSWQGGLLIQHVDNSVGSNKWVSGQHQGVLPEQASTANCDMINTTCRGNATTLFYSGNNSAWGPSTTPGSNYYSGTPSSFSLTNIGAAGCTMTFNMTAAGGGVPGGVTLISPSGTTTTSTPTFTWSAASSATWYYLYVDDSSGHRYDTWYTAAQVGCPAGTGNCSITPSTALNYGAGQWWVQTYNSYGNGPWSGPLGFNIYAGGGIPGGVTLISPSGTTASTTPTFTWTAAYGATYYELYVTDSTGLRYDTWYTASTVGCSSGTGNCSIAPSTILASGAGQWWVRTWNSYGYGPWSGPLGFSITGGGAPGGVTLISPYGTITDDTPTFTWGAAAGATYYELYVSDSSGFRYDTWYTASAVGCPSGSGNCSITPSTSLHQGAAQWWVRTWNSYGYGPWTGPLNFSVQGESGVTLISPVGSIATGTPTFTWSSASGATWYNLYVDDSAGHRYSTWYTSAQVGCSSGTGNCSITPSTVLNQGSGQWWIQTYTASGYGPWYGPANFNVTVSATYTAEIMTLKQPLGATVGSGTFLNAQVKNTSTSALPSNAVVWFYVSGPNMGGTYVGSTSVSGLGAGLFQWFDFLWAIPSTATPGTYTYSAIVYVGSSNAISAWSASQTFTVSGASSCTSPPGLAVLSSPTGTVGYVTPTYQWSAVTCATWYELYVSDTTGNPKIDSWYSASEANCASGSGTCAITPVTAIAPGAAYWYIRTYGPGGYGPWTAAKPFTVSVTTGQTSFVLSWGATPRDLDSHLVTPSINGTSYHVYYSSKGSDTGAPFAKLDVDDTTGYGPETLTIYQIFSGTYKYYVYNFANDANMVGCGAQVKVYGPSGTLIDVVTVPSTGTGRYWNVGTLVGNTWTRINTILSTAPTEPEQSQMPLLWEYPPKPDLPIPPMNNRPLDMPMDEINPPRPVLKDPPPGM